MATPTVQYNTKTGAKLKAGESTMVNGKSQVAGSAYTGANAYGSGSNKVNYSNKTGAMLAPNEKTTYAGKEVTQGDTIDPTATAPTQAQVNPPNVPTADPSLTPGNIKLTPQQQATYNTAIAGGNQAGSQYKNALATTTANGTPDAKNMGEAGGVMDKTIQSPQTDPSPLTPIVDTDSTFDDIFSQYDDFYSPVKQKQSLLQEYQSMEKSLGINAMNAELLNSKRIIEGTEDDIRSEVQAVSGFATDSQVMALANARNKSLVKNYNYLLEARDSAMTQLSTMMNLSMQDRQLASQEFDRKMNFAFKVKEFQEKAISNAREGYNNTIKLMGADGMYNALLQTGDPKTMLLAERTLGIPAGGLAIAAQQAIKARTFEDAKSNLELSALRANINQSNASAANSYANTAKTKAETNALTTPSGTSNSADQLSFLRTTIKEANDLSSAAGPSYIMKKAGDFFVGDSKFRQLEAKTNTLRTNVLTLMTNPDVKKFFGPQMSEGDVRLMTAAGTTLNPENNSPAQMKLELNRLDNLLNRMQTAVTSGGTTGQNLITAPDGRRIIITN